METDLHISVIRKGFFYLCLSFPIYHLLSILNDPTKPDLLPSTSSTNPKVRGQSCCVDHKLYVGLFCGNFRVLLDFLFKPVKRITCSAPTFFFCRCWAAWGSCSPGQYPLDAWRSASACHDSHLLQFPPFPMSEYRVQSSPEEKKTRGRRRRAGLLNPLFRPGLTPLHTFRAKPWFVCNVVIQVNTVWAAAMRSNEDLDALY